jgi:hypothetical protein
LGTKWEQDWQYQPNAATMYVRLGSIGTDQRNGVSFDQQDGSAVGGFQSGM